MSEPVLITPRRNFLVRALGFTAAGAALTVPIVTVASAEERLKHHMEGVQAAMRDLFPSMGVVQRGNCLNGAHAAYQRIFAQSPDDGGLVACAMVLASPAYRGEAGL